MSNHTPEAVPPYARLQSLRCLPYVALTYVLTLATEAVLNYAHLHLPCCLPTLLNLRSTRLCAYPCNKGSAYLRLPTLSLLLTYIAYPTQRSPMCSPSQQRKGLPMPFLTTEAVLTYADWSTACQGCNDLPIAVSCTLRSDACACVGTHIGYSIFGNTHL